MAIKGFLLQGFTAQTHLAAVKRVLSCPNLDKAILSIAFANKAGVDLLAAELTALGSKVDIYAGIRNDCQRRCNIRPRGGVKSGHAAVTGAMARALTR